MISNGWLSVAKPIASPHFNDRPDIDDISLLVIHNISLPPNVYGNNFVEQFFLGQLDSKVHPYFEEIASLQVSSHLYIKRDGEIIQFVGFNDRAWHAGQSTYLGRDNCNDFSIGIELEGSDFEDYTDQQYRQLINATIEIRKAYPKILLNNLVGHCDIAPTRKTDPGPFFDWKTYKREIQKIMSP